MAVCWNEAFRAVMYRAVVLPDGAFRMKIYRAEACFDAVFRRTVVGGLDWARTVFGLDSP